MKVLPVVMIALSCLGGASTGQPSDGQVSVSPLDTMSDFSQRLDYVLNVKPFVDVDAFCAGVFGIQSDLGLDDSTFEDYLRLRLKNNLSNYPLLNPCNKSDSLFASLNGDKAVVLITIWTVGTEYPIALYIKLHVTISYSLTGEVESTVHDQEHLGVCSRATCEDRIKTSIDEMVENLAITFLKAKGDI